MQVKAFKYISGKMRHTMAGITETIEEASIEWKETSDIDKNTDKTESDDVVDLTFHDSSLSRSSQKSKKKVCTVTIDKELLSGDKSKNPITISIDQDVLDAVSSAMSVSEHGDEEDDPRFRKSSIFCFFCCDMIKACIIMNSIYIVLLTVHVVISLMGVPVGIRMNLYTEDDIDGLWASGNDDDMWASEETLDPWGIIAYTKTGLGVIFAIVGIIGAARFQKYMVLSSAIWNCIYIFLTMFQFRVTPAILTLPFAYTNIHCFITLQSGNISRENYVTEKQCCCIVNNYYTDDYYEEKKKCGCCCSGTDDDESYPEIEDFGKDDDFYSESEDIENSRSTVRVVED